MFGGRTLTIHTSDLTETQVATHFEPMLREHASKLQRFNDEEREEQSKVDAQHKSKRMAQAADVGDYKRTLSVEEKLAQIHGAEGKPSKSRRFARHGQEVIRTSQSVRAAGLREANCDSSSDESVCREVGE